MKKLKELIKEKTVMEEEIKAKIAYLKELGYDGDIVTPLGYSTSDTNIFMNAMLDSLIEQMEKEKDNEKDN